MSETPRQPGRSTPTPQSAPVWDRRYGQLPVATYPSSDALGAAAADAFATVVGDALRSRPTVAVILATGNSQLPFFAALRNRSDVDWSRIDVFHMDEYLGMSPDHPASFRRYLHEQLVDVLGPRAFHGMR